MQNLSVTTPTAIQTARQITLANAAQTFLYEELLGASRATLKWYECRVGLFVKAIGPDTLLSDINSKMLIDWWRGLESRTQATPRTLTPDSFHGYVRGARRLLQYLYKEHLIAEDFLRYIPLPNLPERQRKGIRDTAVISLLDAATDNIRDRAILMFMEATGCRRGGVATLTLDHIDLDAEEPYCRRAEVNEKGLKSRTVMMSDEAADALRAWLAVRPKSTSPYVFIDERPGRHNNGLLPGAINQIIARYKERLGITGACSPHQWRHRFFRRLLKRRIPLSTVQQIGGHKNVVITGSIYGNLLVDELQQAYDSAYEPPSVVD